MLRKYISETFRKTAETGQAEKHKKKHQMFDKENDTK